MFGLIGGPGSKDDALRGDIGGGRAFSLEKTDRVLRLHQLELEPCFCRISSGASLTSSLSWRGPMKASLDKCRLAGI